MAEMRLLRDTVAGPDATNHSELCRNDKPPTRGWCETRLADAAAVTPMLRHQWGAMAGRHNGAGLKNTAAVNCTTILEIERR